MGKSGFAISVRVFAALCFLVGGVLMLFSKQKKSIHGFEFVARNSDWTGIMICAIVSIFASVYNILILLIIPANNPAWKAVIFIDVAICGLVCAGLGAGWETYALLGEGNRHAVYADWRPVCGLLPNLCRLLLNALITSTAGFVLSFGLFVYCLRVIMATTMSLQNELRAKNELRTKGNP